MFRNKRNTDFWNHQLLVIKQEGASEFSYISKELAATV